MKSKILRAFTNQDKICQYARNKLREGLAKCTIAEQEIFKQMYSHDNLKRHTNEIIERISEEKLDWALCQIERTLEKRGISIEEKKVAPYIYSKITSQENIENARNWMAKGNYPLSMTDCEVVGINGDCGLDCPVWIRGDCEFPEGMIPIILENYSADEIEEICDEYPSIKDELNELRHERANTNRKE